MAIFTSCFLLKCASQKAVFVVAQSVFFLDAAQGAFNAAGQLVNAAASARASHAAIAALARATYTCSNALCFMSDFLGANNIPRPHFGKS